MIQVVCVKWGTRYSAVHVNGLYQAITKRTQEPVRFVCVTDQFDDSYDERIHLQPFPDFGVPLDDLKPGCRAKLAIFFEGMLQPGLETIFLDLDTMVRGDLGVLAKRLRDRPGIYVMRNHYVPFWRVSKLAKRLFPNRYYFGNSSILAFYPEDYYWLADLLKEKLQTGETYFRKSLDTDERFISCYAWERLRVFSPRDAVKFGSEFMTPWPVVEAIRKRLPWVANRRRNLTAITFAGEAIKPDLVANLASGQVVKIKRTSVVWDHEEYSQYWREISAKAA